MCHVSHYQTTAGLLFLSTSLLGLTDIFGKQILCRGQEGDADTAIREVMLLHSCRHSEQWCRAWDNGICFAVDISVKVWPY